MLQIIIARFPVSAVIKHPYFIYTIEYKARTIDPIWTKLKLLTSVAQDNWQLDHTTLKMLLATLL